MKKINPVVEKYVQEKNVGIVRSSLARLAYVGDKDSFESFKDSTEYAKDMLENIFEPDDGEVLNLPSNIENYKLITKMMMDNFSESKYKKAISIGMSIFETSSNETVHQKESSPKDDSFMRASNSRKVDMKKIVITAVIVILLVIAFILLKKK